MCGKKQLFDIIWLLTFDFTVTPVSFIGLMG